MACANEAAPLLLPWYNVTVSEDGEAWTRGIEISIGTPKQVLSLRPSIADETVWVFSLADCKSATNDSCIGTKGGVFDSNISSTYRVTTAPQWNGTGAAGNQGIFFNDDITFGSNGSAYGFPFLMDAPEFNSVNGLGIGAKSTFLDVAVSSGAAPSRSWGLWTGSRSVQNSVDGLLVIGGYDTARVPGELTRFNSFQGCQTCTVVTNLTYDSPNGTVSLFSNSSAELEIALEPFERTLGLPQDIFDNFGKASGGKWNPEYGWYYPATDAPTGNLTVTLIGGYKTTIPAEELFQPPRLYNPQGVYSISNNSIVLAEVSNGTDPKYVVSWGIPYLTMNYLIVHSDEGFFKMAPAYREDFGQEGGALIQKLCTGLLPATTSSTSSPVPTSTTSSYPTATSSASPVPHKTSHTGAIVGGVVGGIGGLALLAALIFFVFRLGRKGRHTSRSSEAARQVEEANHGAASPRPDEKGTLYLGGPLSTTTETTRTELPSPSEREQNVSQWLSVHQPEEDVKMTHNGSARFEMPASRDEHHDL